MRICIDISPAAHRKAGLGRHARELAERAPRLDAHNEYSLFTYQPSRGQVPGSLAHLPTYRTDEHGTIEIVSDGSRAWVKTER